MAEKLPEWNAVGVEPPQSLKDSGWQPGMKPSAQHMNWLLNRAYKCIEELQQAGGNVDDLTQAVASLEQTVGTHLNDNLSHTKWIETIGGTANALTATIDGLTSYKNGLAVSFPATSNSTAAVTLNINSLGAIPIKKANGTAVTNLKVGGVYTLRYSGSAFILQGEGGAGNAQPSEVLTGKTFTNDDGEFVGTMQVGSVIKSIQKGSRVIPTNTTRVDIPITTVNRSLSFIKTSFTTNSSIDQDVFPFVSFLDNSTISVSKPPAISGTGSIVLEWEVVEFVSGVKISSGGTGINASYFVETTVPQYDVNKALIFMSYSITQGGQASYGIKNLVSATKKDSTTIRFQRDTSVASGISTSISWFLVEFL